MAASGAFRLAEYVFKSRRYILEMLNDRGFTTTLLETYTSVEMNSLLLAQESGDFTNKPDIGPLDIVLEKTVGEKREKIYIKYRLDEKFRERESLTSQIDDIFASHLSKGDCLIILNMSRIYSKAGSKADSGSEDFVRKYYVNKGYFVQMFGLENFLFNVSKHQFVPKHEIISKEEVAELMTRYNITNLKSLPTIKWLDPQAKYIGLKPKMIAKITSLNATTGESIKYRVCVL